MWSRHGTDLTAIFPELAAAAAATIPAGCIVDGEAVIWTADRLDFDTLQRRLARGARAARRLAHAHPASFVGFDVLAVAARDVRHLQLQDRRRLLEELAAGWYPPLNLSPVTRDVDEARQWFDTLAVAGVEGLVVKGAAQRYGGGERQWLKIKHRDTLDVIAGAVTGPLDRPETVVLGMPVDGALRIVGRSTSLSAAAARRLAAVIHPPVGGHPWRAVVKPGALDRFNARRDPVELTLIEPLVVEVSADVAMSGSSFRHAVRFLRPRPELDVDDIEPGGS